MSERPYLRLYDGFSHTSPNLREHVQELQSLLRKFGYKMASDGRFGPYTESVVRLFQTAHGMQSDGVVGPSTWLRLNGKQETTTSPLGVSTPKAATVFESTYDKENKTLLKQLVVANKYRDIVKHVGKMYGFKSSTIGGIVSRESAWGLSLDPLGPSGTGDGGHGRGLMQVDDRWHIDFIDTGKWKDAKENLLYGAAVLQNCVNYFRKKTHWKEKQLLKAGIAGYNCGPRRAYEAVFLYGMDLDYYTAGRDYSKDVISRVGWFKMHGWD